MADIPQWLFLITSRPRHNNRLGVPLSSWGALAGINIHYSEAKRFSMDSFLRIETLILNRFSAFVLKNEALRKTDNTPRLWNYVLENRLGDVPEEQAKMMVVMYVIYFSLENISDGVMQ